MKRRICPECGEDVAVFPDGTLAFHWSPNGRSYRGHCKLSGPKAYPGEHRPIRSLQELAAAHRTIWQFVRDEEEEALQNRKAC